MDLHLQENLTGCRHDSIAPFLWLHGEEHEPIKNELHRVYESGIRSVCLESRPHPNFCREQWFNDVQFIFDECEKLGMHVWILDDKHYPTGWSNGLFADEKYAQLRLFGITEKHMDICGPAVDCSVMADCWIEDEADELIAVLALHRLPNSNLYDEVIDITDGVDGGMVYFSLPDGLWRIVFIKKSRQGIGDYYKNYGDMLHPDAVKAFINEVYEPHYAHFKKYFGNTFLGFFSDEPGFKNNTASGLAGVLPGTEYAHFPWNDNIMNKMREKYAKKFRSALASLWFEFADKGMADIRETYMDIITNEYKNNFTGALSAWCHNHGVRYIGHIIEDNNAHYMTGPGAGHYFRSLSGQDMAGIDVVLHQIVPGLAECSSSNFISRNCNNIFNNTFFHYVLAKLASSMAHTDPGTHGKAMCEIFGAYGWAEGTKVMKYLADHMLVRGINYFVPHAFSPKPNDPDCPPTFYNSGRNPQYKFFKNIMDYMNRMCHIFDGARHIPTCAILYDAEANWRTRNNLPLENVAKKLHDNLLDFDIIPIDYLDNMDKNGCLNGEKYPVLLIPYSENPSPKLIEATKKLSIPVISVSDGDRTDDNYKNIDIEDLTDYMAQFRDISSDYKGKHLRYCHYERGGAHFYMFTNEDVNNTLSANLSFSRFSGGQFVVYDAMENKAFTGNSDGNISISIPPYGATVIITGDVDFENLPKINKTDISSVSQPKLTYDISVKGISDTEYRHYKRTDNLFNICGRNELPHFAGNIKYETELDIPALGNYEIDFGNVGETAELFVNDKYVGCKIFPPYKFDISDYVSKGTNNIRVIISTTLAYELRDDFSRFMKFEPYGLLGPVELIQY